MAIARYTLAVDRRFKKDGEQQADFIGCVTFGKNAEFVEKYFRKGTKVAVVGRIQTGSYTNSDGVKVYTTDVVTEEHEFAESKAASQDSASSPQNSASSPQDSASTSHNSASAPAPTRPTPSAALGDGFMSIPDGLDDEELPFN